MSKAVIILASPRKDGNSAALADQARRGFEDAGGIAEAFYLNGMNIRPCQACGHCQRHPEKGCILRDDMHLIYGALASADALLLASPIYMFTMTAQLKLFSDRCYAVPDSIKGKRVGILLTYGDEDEFISGAVNAIAALRDEYRYKCAAIVGIVHGSAGEKGAIKANARVMDDAYALGRKLFA
ncbi:MAG TPA: flavodoxin family protein, partial [Clostridia bacterium]|nr:flavodoxin family protein [Clostridia bacterium]